MAGIVIIGAGECGVRAAFALREGGYTGSVTLIGEENSLPYERPPLSKGDFASPRAIRSRDKYAEVSVDLCLGGRVESINPVVREVAFRDGTRMDYEQLLLATGARARLFPGMDGCLTLRTDADAEHLMRHMQSGARVGIVGGGFIGLELAATARQSGADVTVVEAGPRLLGRAVPAEIAQILHERHINEGVSIRTANAVAGADAKTITLSDGTVLKFDVVIAGVGALPNTFLAEAAGLRVDNGIVVDSAFRTSAAGIYAAGDCCNFPWRGQKVRLESWKAAQDHGAHAAAAMLGDATDYAKVPWFWSDQYDLNLQVAGLFDLTAPIARRVVSEDTCLVYQFDEAQRLSAAAGIGIDNSTAKDIRILEKLIERGTPIEPSKLSDPSFNLKSLLKAA